MEEKVKIVQKNSKQFQYFLKLLLVIIGTWILYLTGSGIYLKFQKPEAFKVVETMDKFGDSKKALMVNGKKWINDVMYNDGYQTSFETGEFNYKASILIEVIITIVKGIFIFSIIFIVQNINGEIAKEVRPFTKKNVKRLRVISILILCLMSVPVYLKVGMTFFVFLKASFSVSLIDLMILLLSFVVWGISYIVEYGYVLQTEVDQLI